MQTAHERAFNHLVDSLNNPQISQSNQAAFNAERLAAVKDSLRLRPAYLPVQIVLPTDALSLPVSNETSPLKYDCIITGAITDGTDKKINLRPSDENERGFVSIGRETGAKISLDAIAGKSLEAAGMNGIQPLQPFLLREGESIAVDIYKPDATASAEKVNIVFCGYRVFSQNYTADAFSDKITAQVSAAIAKNASPQPRFAVCGVVFGDDGYSVNVQTPEVQEPRLILGFRSTVQNALCNLGFDSETVFAKDLFPIWALAAEAGNNSESYRLLKSPIFIEAGGKLYFTLKNSIDGATFAQNGQIEVLMQTV
jgi:hypothetical protein